MTKSDAEKPGEREFRAMTPAHIRERPGAEYVELVFLESARFYKLFKKNPAFEQIVEQLRDAIAKKRALEVRYTSPQSDVIEDVRAPAQE